MRVLYSVSDADECYQGGHSGRGGKEAPVLGGAYMTAQCLHRGLEWLPECRAPRTHAPDRAPGECVGSEAGEGWWC